MSKIKKGMVRLKYTDGKEVEMPRSEALAYEPKPIVEGNSRFIWVRNVSSKQEGLFRERLGDSVRFGAAVSPITGQSVPNSISLFIRDDHEFHTLGPEEFRAKHGWT